MFLLVGLGVVFFVGIIYLAVSKKSGTRVRVAALAALASMVLAVIVSMFVVFGVGAAEPVTMALPEPPPLDTPPAAGTDFVVMLLFVIFLLAIFFLVLALSLREQRKKGNRARGD